MTREIVVLGGSGFIGRKIIELLARLPDTQIRVLTHRTTPRDVGNVSFVPGDLLERESVTRVLVPGCVVINLVYISDSHDTKDNERALTNLCEASAAAGVLRLVHCSTAVVVGRTTAMRVDENTPCHPRSTYEKSKLALERLLFRLADNSFEAVVLRPSAVVGTGSENLLKFAQSLTAGRRLHNYLRSSVFGQRTLNLVHVENVAAALVFLALTRKPVAGEVFLISDDDVPDGRFRVAEQHLMAALAVPDYSVPPLPVPPWLLSALLRVAGRSNINPQRIYDDSKLRRLGFEKPAALSDGIRDAAISAALSSARVERFSAVPTETASG